VILPYSASALSLRIGGVPQPRAMHVHEKEFESKELSRAEGFALKGRNRSIVQSNIRGVKSW